jgi:hypothetical protein
LASQQARSASAISGERGWWAGRQAVGAAGAGCVGWHRLAQLQLATAARHGVRPAADSTRAHLRARGHL